MPTFPRYVANRQPGKALTYFLRLRRPNVFDLIRENNLFTDVQDQALLLVEFDHELMEKRKQEGQPAQKSEAITLLVDHIHSIPVSAFFACSYKRYLNRGQGRTRGATAAEPAVLPFPLSRRPDGQRASYGVWVRGHAGTANGFVCF